MNRKFTLEFDKPPALLFVQERVGNQFTLYENGRKVTGIRTLDINASYDDITTHKIEYITGGTTDIETVS
ncbi:hypothetical protein PghCCS26_47550 [Paenibacillus glycanilyticus]|uniref:Uncharacterized protein n=1 Tax=Paenibacillus glycanilyticus TaxID=126569 RepID=A0ABQ6NU83_9BACL|nr:hypothetical protein [Paenibacillus glycanilyticus]GMK47625.1 hypothetical protein PghCCS26_47550 [Paenibacillus glycanilyticus]